MPAGSPRSSDPPRSSALDIYQKLQDAGTFAASDMTYVDAARAQLKKARAERAADRGVED